MLFADEMILYKQDPEDSTRKLQLINTFSSIAGCKLNMQKSVALLCKNIIRAKEEILETIPLTKVKKTKQNKKQTAKSITIKIAKKVKYL